MNVHFVSTADSENVSLAEREVLLSEVYELLRLELNDDEDADRIQTPNEKMKYEVALQLSKEKGDAPSPGVVLMSPRPSSPMSHTSSPTPKLRKKSDSDLYTREADPHADISSYCTLPRQRNKTR